MLIPSRSFDEVFKVDGIHYSLHLSGSVRVHDVDDDQPRFSRTIEKDGRTLKVQYITDTFYVDSLKRGIQLPDWLSVIVPIRTYFNRQNSPKIPSVVIAPWVTVIQAGSFNQTHSVTFSPNSQLRELQGFSRGSFRSITIPNSVRNILPKCFSECNLLKTIEFEPNSQLEIIDGFSNCRNLSSVSIPDSVLKIGSRAFEECESLTSFHFSANSRLTEIYGFVQCGFVTFTVPPNLETFGFPALRACYSLCFLEFPSGSRLRKIDGFQHIRLGIVRLPESNEVVGLNAFRDCIDLSAVIISGPEELKSLGGFCNCPKLFSLIVSKLEWIANGVWDLLGCPILREINGFDKCQLISIIFPENIEKIKGFMKCRQLREIIFSRSGKLKSIEGFSETAIKRLEVPSSVEEITNFDNCEFLEKIEFANDGCLQKIQAFRYAERLTEVVIPNSVESLGQNSFSDCDQLRKVLLPLNGNLSTLRGFSRIPITSIVIPDSVEFIDGFSQCSALTVVTFGPGSKLRTIRGFEYCGFVEFELPDSVEIVASGILKAEEFRVMKIGIESKLTKIETGFFENRPRFFLVAPEQWMSMVRHRSQLQLSPGKVNRKAKLRDGGFLQGTQWAKPLPPVARSSFQ
jgi:hypothetical protein